MAEETTSSGSTTENATTNPTVASTEDGVTNPPGESVTNPPNDVNNPSNENPTATEDLNFDEVMGVPNSKEEREGKSRREWAEANGYTKAKPAVKEDEDSDDDGNEGSVRLSKIEEENAQLRKTVERLDSQSNANTRSETESKFKSILEGKGISIKDFKDKHYTEFNAKRDEYLKHGMNPEAAVLDALDVVVAKYESVKNIQESEDRSNGRKRAGISPQGNVAPGKNTYSQAELANMDQSEYDAVMNAKERGEVKIV